MPQVVEFVDPAEKRAQGREARRRQIQKEEEKKRHQQDKNKSSGTKKKQTPLAETKESNKLYDPDKAEERREFHRIYKEVVDLGATAFDRKNKKVWEAKKLKNAGVKVDHKEKMPYKMWLGVKRERERKETKREEELKESQVVTGKKAKKSKKRNSKPFVPDPSMSLEKGKYKDGVLHVNPKLLQKDNK